MLFASFLPVVIWRVILQRSDLSPWIAITQLMGQIDEKEEVIQILGEQVNRQRLSLADLVRKSAAINDFSLVEVLLSKKSFSDFKNCSHNSIDME